MKNPIAHLKHLWKDPINTIEEADARKKEVMPWFIGSVALAVVPGVLSGFLNMAFLTVFTIVFFFAALAFGFMLFVIKKAKEKFKALTCNKCNVMAQIKTTEDFNKYVSYVISGNEAAHKGVSHPASNDGVVSEVKASAAAKATADIDLTCPHCGTVKQLKYHIVPFKCSAVQTKVRVKDLELVKAKIDTAVRTAVADYNNPHTRKDMPYSIHSVNHPNYENRANPQLKMDGCSAYPDYHGARIDYRKDPEEMVEQFFVNNQLDGTIVDCTSAK